MPLQKDSKQSQSESAPKVVVGRQLTLKDFVRKKRTRIRRSCDLCRKRKIKCDSNAVRPCTGCRNSGDDCEFLFEARRPGPTSKAYLETLEDRLKRLEGLLSSQQTPADYYQATQQSEPAHANDTQPTSSQQAIATSSEVVTNASNKGYVDVRTSNEGLYMLYDSLLQFNSIPGNLSWLSEGELDDGQKNEQLAISYPEKQRLIQSIPGFTEDLADKMIHAYFESVHPFSPVLDKRTFLLQYYYQYPQPLDSYLFYAVCTAGSRVLPLDSESSGSSSGNLEAIVAIAQQLQKEALKIAQVAPYQQSNITSLQTLLILGMLGGANAGEEAANNVNWFLTGMTIRMAQDLELHIGSRQSHLPPGEIELRRRIAYVVCILDKTIAAAFDKPFTIKDDEFDVALPSIYETPLEDSGFILDESSTVPLILRQTEAAIREQQPVYTSFLRMISLCQMFGHVITSLYSTNSQKTPLADTFFIQSLDMALADWKRELQSSQHGVTNTICKGGVLNIFYNCIVLLLYRPLVMDPNRDVSTENTSQLVTSCNMVSVNIIDMIEMSENLGVRCMSWSMVDYAVGQASIVFLYRAQSRDVNTRYQGYIHLLRCAKMYKNDDTMSRSRNAMLLEHAAQQVASTLGMPSSLGDISLGQSRVVELEEPVQVPDSSVQQLHLTTSTSPSTPSSSGTYPAEQQESSEVSIQGQPGVDELAADIQADKTASSQYILPLTVDSPLEVTSQQPAIPTTNISGVNQGLNSNTSSNMALLNYYLTALEIVDQSLYPDESENPYRG